MARILGLDLGTNNEPPIKLEALFRYLYGTRIRLFPRFT